MAADVQVDISDRAIIQALNTPGGGVFEWRDDAAEAVVNMAIGMSPINDVFNALHRMGAVGEYIASWGWDRMGSNGHTVRATIYNGSDHADIVEFGRRRSRSREVFSWTGHTPPGSTHEHKYGTSSRIGKHILSRSVSARGAATGDWAPLGWSTD